MNDKEVLIVLLAGLGLVALIVLALWIFLPWAFR